MSGLTKISFVEDLGSTPATVNRNTGEMYISARMWRKMTPDQRFFMILHEQGHVVLKTTSEFEADRYAFEQYVKTGRSLKSCISALTGVLSGNSPEHLQRAKALLKRAKLFDKKIKNKMQPSHIIAAATFKKVTSPTNQFVDFGGRGKKRREDKREKKHEIKMVRAESKAYKREAKGDKKRNNSEANIILAEQGINGRAQLASGILGGMAKVAGAVGGSIVGASAVKALPSMLGGGGSQSTNDELSSALAPPPLLGQIAGLAPQMLGALGSKVNEVNPMEYQPQIQDTANRMNARYANQSNDEALEKEKSEKEKSKNNMMIFAGIGAVILIGIIVFIATKK